MSRRKTVSPGVLPLPSLLPCTSTRKGLFSTFWDPFSSPLGGTEACPTPRSPHLPSVCPILPLSSCRLFPAGLPPASTSLLSSPQPFPSSLQGNPFFPSSLSPCCYLAGPPRIPSAQPAHQINPPSRRRLPWSRTSLKSDSPSWPQALHCPRALDPLQAPSWTYWPPGGGGDCLRAEPPCLHPQLDKVVLSPAPLQALAPEEGLEPGLPWAPRKVASPHFPKRRFGVLEARPPS